MQQKKQIRQCCPELLDPVFLKNIQKTTSLPEYYKQHQNATIDKKGLKTLQKHIENYSITVDVAKMTWWDRLKFKRSTQSQNHAISYKIHKYLLASKNKLQELKMDSTSITSVLNSRKTCLNRNIASSEPDANIYLNMMESWIKTNDLEKIRDYVFFCYGSQLP